MKKENLFYLEFVATMLAIRTWVFLFPQRKLIIDGTLIHHFWTGTLAFLLGLLLPKRYAKLRLAIFSIGGGLMADELVYTILGGRTVSEYWMVYSVLGSIVMAVIIFFVRKKVAIKI